MSKFKGSSKQDKKKKKGPKGKKARMKQKLDRQWGELEDPKKASKPTSKRTTDRGNPSKEEKEKWFANGKNSNTKDIMEADNDIDRSLLSEEEDDHEGDEDTATTKPLFFNKLMQSILQQQQGSNARSGPSKSSSSQLLDIDYDDGSMDDDDPVSHSQQSFMAPDEIGTIDRKQDDATPTVPVFKDQFMERFIQNCQPIDEAASNHSAAEVVPLAKIQDNPNLHIQLSPSLLDQWYFGTMSQKDESPPKDSSDKESTESIISKSWLQPCAKLCSKQLPLAHFFQENIREESLFQYVVPSVLLPAVTSYADVCVTTDGTDYGASNNDREERTILDRLRSLHTVTAIHILHHVLASRQVIQQHNQRLSQQRSSATSKTVKEKAGREEEWKKDQGYTRPTVLVLLPTRNCCYDFVQILLSLLYGDGTGPMVDNADRFAMEFGPPPVSEENVDKASTTSLEQRQHRQRVLRQKGVLWNELFGDHRNDDDDFKIGLQVNLPKKKKATTTSFSGSIKLYSDFYRSDIILASPLGLKMAVVSRSQEEEDDDTDGKPTPGGTDFLSSIEICFIARADVLLQQNWDHVTDVLRLLNQLPKSMNDTDFSRVRPYFLADQAQHWRQLILSSRHADPLITSTFQRYSHRRSVVHLKRKWDVIESSLQAVRRPGTRQVFQRVPTTAAFGSAGTDRVHYFLQHIWPELEKSRQSHTLVFIPSYFDFVALRNRLLQREQDGVARIDFVSVTEYSRVSEVSRGRARFLQGRKEVLLYTGRAHYFLRHAIKGVRHLIFLGLPEEASFYAEHVNRLSDTPLDSGEEDNGSSCVALFTKYDSYALERIVGSANCRRMIKEGGSSTFSFTS